MPNFSEDWKAPNLFQHGVRQENYPPKPLSNALKKILIGVGTGVGSAVFDAIAEVRLRDKAEEEWTIFDRVMDSHFPLGLVGYPIIRYYLYTNFLLNDEGKSYATALKEGKDLENVPSGSQCPIALSDDRKVVMAKLESNLAQGIITVNKCRYQTLKMRHKNDFVQGLYISNASYLLTRFFLAWALSKKVEDHH